MLIRFIAVCAKLFHMSNVWNQYYLQTLIPELIMVMKFTGAVLIVSTHQQVHGSRKCKQPLISIVLSIEFFFWRIGKYILLQPQPTSRWFPAHILDKSLDSTQANLIWYSGNIYQNQKGEKPSQQIFMLTPQECFAVLHHANSWLIEVRQYFSGSTLNVSSW